MKNKITLILILLLCQISYCQGLSINQLTELRTKSISDLDISLNNLNYKLEKAVQQDNVKQLNYESQSNKFKESVTVHQFLVKDSFITYYYDSNKIQSKLIEEVKSRNASLVKERITGDGNIVLHYRTTKYIYFFVKNEDISCITIYDTKDFDKHYGG